MFYGSSSGASMSLPSKNRMKRQSKTFTQVHAQKHAHSVSGNHDGLAERKFLLSLKEFDVCKLIYFISLFSADKHGQRKIVGVVLYLSLFPWVGSVSDAELQRPCTCGDGDQHSWGPTFNN